MKKGKIIAILFLVLPLALMASEPEKKSSTMPEYGNWETFTTKNGLPANKIYCVKADGDRVWIGTSHGLVLYENNEFKTFTVEDGLVHPGVLAIAVSELTGDVWIGTLGGMNRYSGGEFETFTQFNSGLANDVIYAVVCDREHVWCATGGGAGHYDTYKEEWAIYTERNAPMHEPWTYSVCAGDNKVWIAAWGGGVIEYQYESGNFRDYIDPDGEMEIDLFPDDGVVHDITTAVSHANGILWVATYFGMSRYDGTSWKGYFDHDSGLASNFINFLRAKDDVVYLCTDEGLSCFNSKEWISYKKTATGGERIYWKDGESSSKADPTGIAHSFTIGVDLQGDDTIWVATSYGLSRGTRIN
jgi:ligand-binding sensor domain-containing protein